MNGIENTKYKSIKKYLPELGFEMSVAHESVLRIDAVPEGLKETQVMKFLENLFEILGTKRKKSLCSFIKINGVSCSRNRDLILFIKKMRNSLSKILRH